TWMRDFSTAPWCNAARAAFTAPQPSWPRIMRRGVWRWTPAYWMLPITAGSITFPATRMTKRSPKPTSNRSSRGTRESLQPRTVANGFWCATNSVAGPLGPGRARPLTNRSLPAIRRARASSAVPGKKSSSLMALLERELEAALEELRSAGEVEAIELAVAVGRLQADVVRQVPVHHAGPPPEPAAPEAAA